MMSLTMISGICENALRQPSPPSFAVEPATYSGIGTEPDVAVCIFGNGADEGVVQPVVTPEGCISGEV
jgi:hypothetical protein